MFLCYTEADLVQLFATEAQGLDREFLRAGWALPDPAFPPAVIQLFLHTECLCHASLLLRIIVLINPAGHCSCGLLTPLWSCSITPKHRDSTRTCRFAFLFLFSPLCPFRIAHFQGSEPRVLNSRHRSVSSREQDNLCSAFKMFLFLSYSRYRWRKT